MRRHVQPVDRSKVFYLNDATTESKTRSRQNYIKLYNGKTGLSLGNSCTTFLSLLFQGNECKIKICALRIFHCYDFTSKWHFREVFSISLCLTVSPNYVTLECFSLSLSEASRQGLGSQPRYTYGTQVSVHNKFIKRRSIDKHLSAPTATRVEDF